jgi:hypothetical protein
MCWNRHYVAGKWPSRACSGVRTSGEPCGAPPLSDGVYCLWHDPEHADTVAEARRLGGSRRRKEATIAVAYDVQGLGSIVDIRRLVEVAALDVLSLENSVGRARAIAYLAQIAAKLLESGEHEERLARIEQALEPRLRVQR